MILNHDYNEAAITQEIEDYLVTISKKGRNYGWNVVEKNGIYLTK